MMGDRAEGFVCADPSEDPLSVGVKLVWAACTRCHGTKCPLLTAFFLFSLFPRLGYFSPRRSYRRVSKFCMGLRLIKKIRFWLRKKFGNCSCNWTEFTFIITHEQSTRPPVHPVKVSKQLSTAATAGFGRRPQLFSLNERRPHFFNKWKTTSPFFVNGRRPQF